jgi:hypothetical protein
MRWVQIISRKGQWEETDPARQAQGLWKHDFSRAVKAAKLMGLQPLRFRFLSLESSETICQIPTKSLLEKI